MPQPTTTRRADQPRNNGKNQKRVSWHISLRLPNEWRSLPESGQHSTPNCETIMLTGCPTIRNPVTASLPRIAACNIRRMVITRNPATFPTTRKMASSKSGNPTSAENRIPRMIAQMIAIGVKPRITGGTTMSAQTMPATAGATHAASSSCAAPIAAAMSVTANTPTKRAPKHISIRWRTKAQCPPLPRVRPGKDRKPVSRGRPVVSFRPAEIPARECARGDPFLQSQTSAG